MCVCVCVCVFVCTSVCVLVYRHAMYACMHAYALTPTHAGAQRDAAAVTSVAVYAREALAPSGARSQIS